MGKRWTDKEEAEEELENGSSKRVGVRGSRGENKRGLGVRG